MEKNEHGHTTIEGLLFKYHSHGVLHPDTEVKTVIKDKDVEILYREEDVKKMLTEFLTLVNFEADNSAELLNLIKDSFKSEFKSSEKLWRTLIRILAVEKDIVSFLIPSWSTQAIIKRNMFMLPYEIKEIVAPGVRLHAKVNIGCEDSEGLIFTDWETK